MAGFTLLHSQNSGPDMDQGEKHPQCNKEKSATDQTTGRKGIRDQTTAHMAEQRPLHVSRKVKRDTRMVFRHEEERGCDRMTWISTLVIVAYAGATEIPCRADKDATLPHLLAEYRTARNLVPTGNDAQGRRTRRGSTQKLFPFSNLTIVGEPGDSNRRIIVDAYQYVSVRRGRVGREEVKMMTKGINGGIPHR